jgi:hypothetical protein
MRADWIRLITAAGRLPARSDPAPDGHFKFPHQWPVKLPQAGRLDYDDSVVMAMRAAASLSR